jgi:polyphenol oxidase
MLDDADVIVPDWPAPSNVQAFFTTRAGGASTGAFASLNLGRSAGDTPEAVNENRRRLVARLPQSPAWLSQVHGARVVDAAAAIANQTPESADAAFTHAINTPCAVMVADCLPVLFCNDEGTVVAAAHAGWRGLAAGVLEAAIAAMNVPPPTIMAWLGPAIGPDAFEVGEDVLRAFVERDPAAMRAFRARGAAFPGKYFADLFALARLRLAHAGVTRVSGGGVCTVSDPARFFSYRRDGKTGRMAAIIWRSA